jgi:hypothetical protein
MGTRIAMKHDQKLVNVTNHRRWMMSKNSALLAMSVAILVSLFFVDASDAIQIVNRKPPVDFLTVVEMYGWTRGPLQVVSILFVIGVIVLAGLGVRKLRHHYHYGHQT